MSNAALLNQLNCFPQKFQSTINKHLEGYVDSLFFNPKMDFLSEQKLNYNRISWEHDLGNL